MPKKKKPDALVFPKNLAEILERDGEWEDDTFEPIHVSVIASVVDGADVTCHQLAIEAGEDFEEIEELMADHDVEPTGDGWESMIRKHLRQVDPTLEAKVRGDSESSTCVLWVADQDAFRELLGHVLDLTGSVRAVKRVLK